MDVEVDLLGLKFKVDESIKDTQEHIEDLMFLAKMMGYTYGSHSKLDDKERALGAALLIQKKEEKEAIQIMFRFNKTTKKMHSIEVRRNIDFSKTTKFPPKRVYRAIEYVKQML
jgi:galactose-1-phosphate uridylyltransferase